jgi:hypothetical protein
MVAIRKGEDAYRYCCLTACSIDQGEAALRTAVEPREEYFWAARGICCEGGGLHDSASGHFQARPPAAAAGPCRAHAQTTKMLKNIAVFAALCVGAARAVAVAGDGDVGAHMQQAMAEYAKVQQVQAAIDAGTFVPSAALTASLAEAKQRLSGLDALMSSMLPAAENAVIESKAKYAALRSVNAEKRAFEEIGLAQLVPAGDALAPLADKMGKLLADWRTIQRVQHDMDTGHIHADDQLRAALHAAHARFDMLDFAMRRASAKWGNSATAQAFMRELGHEHDHEHAHEHEHAHGGLSHHAAAARRHAAARHASGGAHHSNPHARGDASTDAAMEFDVKAWVAMNTPLGLASSASTPTPVLNPVHFSWLSLNAHPEEIDAHLDRLHAQADALGSVYRYGNYVFAETEAEAETEEDAEAVAETEEDAEAEVEEDAEAETEEDAEESEDAERVTVSQTSVAVAELHSVPLTVDEKLAALQADSAAVIEARGTAAVRGAERLASRA